MNIKKSYIKFQSKFPLIVGMLLLIGMSCEDRYYPEIDRKYEQVLVVDGMISENPGPYTVKLSMSTQLENPQLDPVSGCQVRIADDAGTTETLSETEAGVYQTAADGIRGIPGRSYRLSITTPDGTSYQSDFEKLRSGLPIDSLYAQVEYKSIEDWPYDLPGYQFYIDVTQLQNDSTYLLWQLQETYKYNADFLIFFKYDGILHRVYNHDTLHSCYKTNIIPELYLLSTQGLSIQGITHHPLLFVGTDSRRLDLRYSLLVQQYNMSKRAYTYWKNIDEQNSQTGDLYTKQPFQVRGNVHNTSNSTAPVFGYFMAAGVSRKRIFVDRPKPPAQMYFSRCVLNDVDYENYGWMFLSPPPPPDKPNYITMDATGARAFPVQSCVDCRIKGGELEKPDFWIDE